MLTSCFALATTHDLKVKVLQTQEVAEGKAISEEIHDAFLLNVKSTRRPTRS